MTILDILTALKNEPKTNTKLEILKEHQDNEVLKRVFKLALDGSLQTGIKQIPENLPTIDVPMTLDEGLTELYKFYNGELTGNDAKNHLATVLGALSEDDRDVLIRVVQKSIDCGIQAKSANKVYGSKFICIEPYMRCSLTTPETIKNITSFKTHGYAVSEYKMDGQFFNNAVRGSNVTHTSRNGKLFDFLGYMDDDYKKLYEIVKTKDSRFSSGVVFSGEGLVLDEQGNILNRKAGNGIIQKANENTISDSEAARAITVLWDIIPFENFQNGEWKVTRKERRELLESAINELHSEKIRMVKYKKVHTIREAFEYNAKVINEKEEGTILKCEDGIWKSHTSPKQLKMKITVEVDLRVVGFNISNKGKRKGVVGSIICESEDGLVNVSVGSGLKEKQETEDDWTVDRITENMDFLLDKILMVKSNGLITNKVDTNFSMFIPRFGEFRFDKDTADTMERIQEIIDSYVEVFLSTIGDYE